MEERMGRLPKSNELWVDGDVEMVKCLVEDAFGDVGSEGLP